MFDHLNVVATIVFVVFFAVAILVNAAAQVMLKSMSGSGPVKVN